MVKGWSQGPYKSLYFSVWLTLTGGSFQNTILQCWRLEVCICFQLVMWAMIRKKLAKFSKESASSAWRFQKTRVSAKPSPLGTLHIIKWYSAKLSNHIMQHNHNLWVDIMHYLAKCTLNLHIIKWYSAKLSNHIMQQSYHFKGWYYALSRKMYFEHCPQDISLDNLRHLLQTHLEKFSKTTLPPKPSPLKTLSSWVRPFVPTICGQQIMFGVALKGYEELFPMPRAAEYTLATA